MIGRLRAEFSQCVVGRSSAQSSDEPLVGAEPRERPDIFVWISSRTEHLVAEAEEQVSLASTCYV